MLLLQYLLKFSISLAVLYIFYRAILRPLTFYQWNRFYLLCYSLLSFVIPFINVSPLLPEKASPASQLVNIIPAVGNYTVTAIGNGQPGVLQSLTLNQWLMIFFCLGMMVMLVKFVYRYISLGRIRSGSVLINKNSDVQLYQTSAPVSPFSFGNAIYFNSSLHTEEELQRIILHEFVHVKQKHSVDIMLGELICVVNWFNPFAWLVRHAIRQNLEFIADNDVIANGLDKKEYQYLLLKVVGIPQYSIASNFNFSSLKKRIAMMNKMKSARLHLAKFMFVLPLMAVLLLAFRKDIDKENSSTGSAKIKNDNDTIPAPPSLPVIVPVTPVPDLSAPPALPANGGLPENVSGISHRTDIDVTTKTKEDVVTVTLKNGVKEVYNFYNAGEKAAYIKKYGGLPKPVPPVAPVPGVPDVPGNVPAAATPPVPAIPGIPAFSKTLYGPNTPLFVVNDIVERRGYDVNTIKPDDIESITVLKGKTATGKYGDKGKNGVEEIILKSPLYIINSIAQPMGFKLKEIRSVDIQEINILSGKEAVDKYGDDAKHGAVLITLKKVYASIPANVLIIIAGIEMPAGTKIEDVVKKEDIESMNVYPGNLAAIKYGDRAKYGAIEIILKKNGRLSKPSIPSVLLEPSKPGNIEPDALVAGSRVADSISVVGTIKKKTAGFSAKDALIILDGNRVPAGVKDYVDPGRIGSISVLKGKQAIDKYGDQGKNGVIEVQTKKI
jgi:beta-lactamase regulating signal transducer with metallopeptidase domain